MTGDPEFKAVEPEVAFTGCPLDADKNLGSHGERFLLAVGFHVGAQLHGEETPSPWLPLWERVNERPQELLGRMGDLLLHLLACSAWR